MNSVLSLFYFLRQGLSHVVQTSITYVGHDGLNLKIQLPLSLGAGITNVCHYTQPRNVCLRP